MRFLMGLCFGGLVTLGLAVAFDSRDLHSAPAPEQTQPTAGPLDAQPAVNTIAAAEPPPPATHPATSPEPELMATSDLPATEAVVSDRETKPQDSEPPAEAIATTDVPLPEPSTAPVPPRELASVTEPFDDTQETAPETTELPTPDAEPPRVSVWKPFHSEISAQGFAKRLTLQLGYPFSVVKAGPAEYHVVFSYAEDSQRDTLTAQIAALTGVTPR